MKWVYCIEALLEVSESEDYEPSKGRAEELFPKERSLITLLKSGFLKKWDFYHL